MRSGQMHSGVVVDGARAEFARQSLIQLICRAYRVEFFQVTGPSWLGSAQFDITAKMPVGASADQVPGMLQIMLEERFGLSLHRDDKVFDVYALTVGQDGLKLKRPPGYDSAASTYRMPGSFAGVTQLLNGNLARPVIDQTGSTGDYSIPIGDLLMGLSHEPEVQARMDDAARKRTEAAPPGLDAFQVIKSWGLQLEPRKVTLPVLVVDHIEKLPTEN